MAVKRTGPDAAKELMDKEGYVYVDVRSVPEFEAGHPTGAYNVPLLHLGPRGMAPNRDFLAVMEKAFPKDAKLVVGCQAGGRSLQAASLLMQSGWTDVVDQASGFQGGPMGPGWAPRGLPTSTEASPDHTWEGLNQK
jgi:rhodanese-related sulfurtransferase